VCWRMLGEAALCFLALASLIATFSSAISVVKHDVYDFQGIFIGSRTLLQACLGLHVKERTESVRREPLVLTLLLIFLMLSIIFILNVFVAQLTCQYSAIHSEMRGLAFLHRANIIVQTMPKVSPGRWDKFKASMRFDERLEFNQGDIGLPGGVQILEPASAHPTTVDRIRRYGGSTSPDLPWPADSHAGKDEAKGFDRLEKLLRRTLEKVETREDWQTSSEVLSPAASSSRQSKVRLALQEDSESLEAGSLEPTSPLRRASTRRVTRFETLDPFADLSDDDMPAMTSVRSSVRRPTNERSDLDNFADANGFFDSDEQETFSNASMDSLLDFIAQAPQRSPRSELSRASERLSR